MEKNNPVIISGSSITDDTVWPTWATWIKELYGLTNVGNFSVKGLGNKTIILKAIKAAMACDQPPLIILQLTSIDKWDWYVENPLIVETLKKEKHPILFLDAQDTHGFWCTGSHFPLWKEYYQEHYFSLTYQAFETLMMLQWFQGLCKLKNWSHQILFESPILSVTESQLNSGQLSKDDCISKKLIENVLCDTVPIDLDGIYLPGLIGYACLENLSWFHDRYRSHPGSYVHYLFTKDVLSRSFDNFFVRQQAIENLEQPALKFQQLLQQ